MGGAGTAPTSTVARPGALEFGLTLVTWGFVLRGWPDAGLPFHLLDPVAFPMALGGLVVLRRATTSRWFRHAMAALIALTVVDLALEVALGVGVRRWDWGYEDLSTGWRATWSAAQLLPLLGMAVFVPLWRPLVARLGFGDLVARWRATERWLAAAALVWAAPMVAGWVADWWSPVPAAPRWATGLHVGERVVGGPVGWGIALAMVALALRALVHLAGTVLGTTDRLGSLNDLPAVVIRTRPG